MALRRLRVSIGFAGCIGLLAGCGTVPSHGPEAATIPTGAAVEVGKSNQGGAQDASTVAQPYVLVHVDNKVLAYLGHYPEPRFAGLLTDRRGPVGLRVGAGDVISVSIFEAAPGGLFTPSVTAGARPGNFVELPPQTVGREGTINVPYAGIVGVANRSPSEIERIIESRLRNRAIEPQVIVTIREQRSAQVSVLGEVNTPTKFTINPQGERVLDAIARAGGPKFPAYETVVAVQRFGKKAQTSMPALIRDPGNNIFVQPGDIIYVSREQRHFVALGASGQNGLFFFDSERVTLSYAMGKAGGMLDERAEPGAVFIYRIEPRRHLERLNANVSEFRGDYIATVYAINLRDPSGFFLARTLEVRDKDVIFVANAVTVDIAKFLNFIRIPIATVRDASQIGRR